ncbi:MFS transporter [Cellulomonas xiejunii]|uniref:MFS transporter n=1 Tax=Cellulomonas xiejunii TaxID=2968083 RepID=A0ABY5KS84_9CELL|nr:MFS transporter [Cellulomonas xiejunii]MCC2314599.1 MFS transporter [Cellulomonas xiejunii]MCC2322681.1 MFS transporter [Cellulomonas xiejunii]UUI72718.1 MFS transporter [Cellulomonas xiejunii]
MTRAAAGRGALLAALLLVSLNLRGPITALAPVVEDVRADLGLTPAVAGLLTGLPILCFAALTPLAAVALARLGTTRMLAGTLVAILLGTLLRSFGDVPGAFVGTLVIGAAVTVGNVGVPIVVARDFPLQVPRTMGLFSAVMNGGAALTTFGTAPLAAVLGWRWALVVWGVLTILALVVWTHVHRDAGVDAPRDAGDVPDPPVGRPAVPVLRRPVTWLLCAAFVGQSAAYMGVVAWLPSVLHDDVGMSRTAAGAAASLFALLGVAGSVLAPAALARRVPPRILVLVVAACWLALPVGLLVAPGGWAVWTVLAGLAQAANFVVLFSVVAAVSRTSAEVRRLSATVQTVGYTAAAATPSVLGELHSATGGWTAPLVTIGALLALMTVTHTVAAGGLARRA